MFLIIAHQCFYCVADRRLHFRCSIKFSKTSVSSLCSSLSIPRCPMTSFSLHQTLWGHSYWATTFLYQLIYCIQLWRLCCTEHPYQFSFVRYVYPHWRRFSTDHSRVTVFLWHQHIDCIIQMFHILRSTDRHNSDRHFDHCSHIDFGTGFPTRLR